MTGSNQSLEILPQSTLSRARAIFSHHAKTFRAASVFLSPEQQDDAAIAYAFCRLVDDAVDEAENLEVAKLELNRLEASLNEGMGDDIVVAYRQLAFRCGFGLEPAFDLIRGARSDLERVRVENDQELLTYCYRVAGTVGLMMCGILGVTDSRAKEHAVDLGIAMQLTNICRDVLEDARRDRIYLPGARLRQAGTTAQAVLEESELPPEGSRSQVVLATASVVDDLLRLADEKYSSGLAGFRYLPARPRLAIQVASHLYRNIGLKLRSARRCNPFLGRVSLSSWYKRALTLRAAISWFRGIFVPSGSVARLPPHPSSPF